MTNAQLLFARRLFVLPDGLYRESVPLSFAAVVFENQIYSRHFAACLLRIEFPASDHSPEYKMIPLAKNEGYSYYQFVLTTSGRLIDCYYFFRLQSYKKYLTFANKNVFLGKIIFRLQFLPATDR